MQTFAIVALLAAVASQVSAICPGYNYGIGNQMNLGGGVSRCTSPLLPLHPLYPFATR